MLIRQEKFKNKIKYCVFSDFCVNEMYLRRFE